MAESQLYLMAISIGSAGACAVLVACSGTGSAGSSSSPPASSQALGGLSLQQQGALCDSLAALAGGYGHGPTCMGDAGATTISFWSDQADCTAGLELVPTTCQATVGQYTPCVQWALSCASVDAPYPTSCADLEAPGCKPTELGVGYSSAPSGTIIEAGADN
jgi:hypothetical protein